MGYAPVADRAYLGALLPKPDIEVFLDLRL